MGQKTSLKVAHGDGIGLRRIADRSAIVELRGIVEPLVAALHENMTVEGSGAVKTETSRIYDGQQGFTLTQGQ